MALKSKSPSAVVVRLGVPGEEPVPVPATAASREFDRATPENSKMATRSGAETVSDIAMVFAPPRMFSA